MDYFKDMMEHETTLREEVITNLDADLDQTIDRAQLQTIETDHHTNEIDRTRTIEMARTGATVQIDAMTTEMARTGAKTIEDETIDHPQHQNRHEMMDKELRYLSTRMKTYATDAENTCT